MFSTPFHNSVRRMFARAGRAPKATKRPLACEQLDARLVPALISGGNLVIDGTSASDTVVVRTGPYGTVEVTENGRFQTFLRSAIPSGKVGFTGYGGNDRFDASGLTSLQVHVNAGPGVDTIYGGALGDVLAGEGDGDDIRGLGGNDVIYGNDGNDWVLAGDGADSVYGGFGNDTLAGEAHGDKLHGEPGADVLYGNDGNDQMWGDNWGHSWGGESGDWLYGGFGNDTIAGEGGHDFIAGEPGSDALNGYDGDDQIWGDNWGNPWGGEGNDTIRGGRGNDTLHGEGGVDLVIGDAGNDGLFGGVRDGRDTLDGGANADRLLIPAAASGTQEDLVQNVGAYPTAQDARIIFRDSPAVTGKEFSGQAGTFSFDAGAWDNKQIERVDVALANLHRHMVWPSGAGNTRLLKTAGGTNMSFLAVGKQTSGGISIGGWNSGTAIAFVDLGSEDDIGVWSTVYHEFGHNWDEVDENRYVSAFRAVSGWIESSTPQVGYTDSIGVKDTWQYLTSKSGTFAREYGKTNPKEDMATTWEAYFLNAYHGGVLTLAKLKLTADLDKWATMDSLFRDLRQLA
jgi:Ca2+-binding RTX toxin-like protein